METPYYMIEMGRLGDDDDYRYILCCVAVAKHDDDDDDDENDGDDADGRGGGGGGDERMACHAVVIDKVYVSPTTFNKRQAAIHARNSVRL